MGSAEIARRVVALLDLTSLGENDDAAGIDILCGRAVNAAVAAVCVWPQFVNRCREQLAGRNIKVATVVNFPHGGDDLDLVSAETTQAIAVGADEIDLVMPYTAWLRGDRNIAHNMIARTKQLCGDDKVLKVILETGKLRTRDRIRLASRGAIDAGADFLKTSTGKIRVSATPSAAETILHTISEADRPIGFKAAGGIRTLRQAANYLRLADDIMGPGWAHSGTFRFGASALLDACQAQTGR